MRSIEAVSIDRRRWELYPRPSALARGNRRGAREKQVRFRTKGAIYTSFPVPDSPGSSESRRSAQRTEEQIKEANSSDFACFLRRARAGTIHNGIATIRRGVASWVTPVLSNWAGISPVFRLINDFFYIFFHLSFNLEEGVIGLIVGIDRQRRHREYGAIQLVGMVGSYRVTTIRENREMSRNFKKPLYVCLF